jgi:putative transposase
VPGTGIQDAAWGQCADLLAYKAAWAGRGSVGVVGVVGVNPAYTSQDRSHCGHRHALSLPDSSDRRYTCPRRGADLDRDHNASLNMLSVGRHAPAPAE